MAYLVASTGAATKRSRPVPAGELHAYLRGRSASVCGRVLGTDLVAFDALRWSARPVGLPTCRICFAAAR